ncbi:MAG: 2OG-Fe(II) oxygenase [Phenylobacterium sp.]|jgi:predicted 2-oxoglutarate/Fe(II)-dependent dioxygenase YbiX/peroxiredoxin|uniref:2OG-Fe(II) oxygenase family protein n=1 Tax=Phenylobacterium sp. TaxID=1871053 RepID=UPI002A3630F7|nr:2OG-Fe(II) oxygenase [Phenylobacterium sp.]MDX9998812.1 2OG-Fe(II) oxygenase [Phenylobacterium sp.]
MSGAASALGITPLALGSPAPWFEAASPENPRFNFHSLGGRFVLLGFLPADEAARASALAALNRFEALYLPHRLVAFAVSREPLEAGRDRAGGRFKWFFDPAGEIFRLYGALDAAGAERPCWVLIDPSLRLLGFGAFGDGEMLGRLLSGLPEPDAHAGVQLHAPVLIVPRVFERSLCRRLIDHYEQSGGEPSGIMVDVGGRTVGVLNDFKRRRDARIDDEAFRAELRQRLLTRLIPEMRKAFQFKATRIERYIVACYDAKDGGYFRPHRDNTTLGTAHRKFACSINLNADEFEGGDLRFPEFGRRNYRAPTGGAVIFSCSLLHEATPVTRGRRYAFLPFFYDEEGARIRQANADKLAGADDSREPVA